MLQSVNIRDVEVLLAETAPGVILEATLLLWAASYVTLVLYCGVVCAVSQVTIGGALQPVHMVAT